MFRARGLASVLPKRQGVRLSAYQARPAPHWGNDFLTGTSAAYLDQLYANWQEEPYEVATTWGQVFETAEASCEEPDAKIGPMYVRRVVSKGNMETGGGGDVNLHIRVSMMVRAFEVRGHRAADLDPLKLPSRFTTPIPDLSLEYWDILEGDLETPVSIGYNKQVPDGFIGPGKTYKIGELFHLLKKTYCGKIGWEYMHIQEPERKNFLRREIQTGMLLQLTGEEKKKTLRWVAEAELFEKFLQRKWPTAKRFGLDGGEATVAGMNAVIEQCVDSGIESVVIGMPHRGRLNVLTNVVGKPPAAVFSEFEGSGQNSLDDYLQHGSGDVKYHLGMSHDKLVNGKPVHLSLVANPSHLELVNPVATGKCRAKQYYSNDNEKSKTMCILLHGDAAFSGQGVCYETMGMSDLTAYSTGGTIHIIVNNQIGFTTDPRASRATPYCTDLAKTVQAPVFHVNGDDPESVVRVCKLAVKYRQRFKKDVVIDLVCYRRYGHNETDEPRVTQPLMYKAVDAHISLLPTYCKQLIDAGDFTENEVEETKKEITEAFQSSYDARLDYQPKKNEWFESFWSGFKGATQRAMIGRTGVKQEKLKAIAEKITQYPADFTPNKKLGKILQNRSDTVLAGSKIDWNTAEIMAFGTLLLEGYHVRVSGQDVERGTFGQRHAVLHDTNDGKEYKPLDHLAPDQSTFEIHNSSLSELGVCGYELGYSLEHPNSLVIWEAQFGDFANGAAMMFDQFISCGEAKWRRQSGITILLPHGYDGQGPEHSSARLERFLQQCDEDEAGPRFDWNGLHNLEEYNEKAIQTTNWQVTMCTLPSNHFHVLRRQLHREFRKPLICMVSKRHLRGPINVSEIEEFADGAVFQQVINDNQVGQQVDPSKVTKVVLCSGQVYYELEAHRNKTNAWNVALIRVEQLAPFPFPQVAATLDSFPAEAEVFWCQEEHKNMGGWTYTRPRIATAINKFCKNPRSDNVGYAGRGPSASTATGYMARHIAEQERFISNLFA